MSTHRELMSRRTTTNNNIGDNVYCSRGEKMPEIDSIILNTAGHISAYGFSGLDEAVKYLSDYPLQLQMVREVFPSEHVHVIDGENMIKVGEWLLIW